MPSAYAEKTIYWCSQDKFYSAKPPRQTDTKALHEFSICVWSAATIGRPQPSGGCQPSPGGRGGVRREERSEEESNDGGRRENKGRRWRKYMIANVCSVHIL